MVGVVSAPQFHVESVLQRPKKDSIYNETRLTEVGNNFVVLLYCTQDECSFAPRLIQKSRWHVAFSKIEHWLDFRDHHLDSRLGSRDIRAKRICECQISTMKKLVANSAFSTSRMHQNSTLVFAHKQNVLPSEFDILVSSDCYKLFAC